MTMNFILGVFLPNNGEGNGNPLQYSCLESLVDRGAWRQEYWSGLPCPHPGNLPNTGIEPISLASPEL